MKKIGIKKIIIALSLLFFVFLNFSIVEAFVPGSVEQSAKYKKGDYELNDILRVGLFVFHWILGIVGSLALLFFVYGGFMFLISAGNEQKVTQAKTIITNAVIGLIIVFGSYMIIEFTLGGLGYNVGNLDPEKIQGTWSGTIFR